MKEKTIKTIANVTGFVAGLVTEVVVTKLLCAHIPAKEVRGVVSKLVTAAGVGVLSWFVGCKVDDYVHDFTIDAAYEIENLKSDIEKKLNEVIDNTEENTKLEDEEAYITVEKDSDKKAVDKKACRYCMPHGFIVKTGDFVSCVSHVCDIPKGAMYWASGSIRNHLSIIKNGMIWEVRVPRPIIRT